MPEQRALHIAGLCQKCAFQIHTVDSVRIALRLLLASALWQVHVLQCRRAIAVVPAFSVPVCLP